MTKDLNLYTKALELGVSAVCPGPLKDWSHEDLHALIEQAGVANERGNAAISEWAKGNFSRPEFLFSKDGQKQFDQAVHDARVALLTGTSEICAAAMLFLPKKELARYEEPEKEEAAVN